MPYRNYRLLVLLLLVHWIGRKGPRCHDGWEWYWSQRTPLQRPEKATVWEDVTETLALMFVLWLVLALV